MKDNKTIEVVAAVNPFDLLELMQTMEKYEQKAERARKEAAEKFKKPGEQAIIWTGNHSDSAIGDPGAIWAAMAAECEVAIMALHRRKMAETVKGNPEAAVTIIDDKGNVQAKPKEQVQPVADKSAKEEAEEAAKDNKDKPAGQAPGKEESAEQKRTRLTNEALSKFREAGIELEQKQEIAALVKSKKEGVFATDKDGNLVEATDKDRANPDVRTQTRMVSGEPYEVKYHVLKKEGKVVKDKDGNPRKGDLVMVKGKIDKNISNKDRRNKNIIIDTITPKKEIEAVRSLADIEKAIVILEEVLKGQGIENVELIGYREMKARCTGIAKEMEQLAEKKTKEEAEELLKKIDMKVGFESDKVYEKDGLAKLNGQFTKNDNFNLTVLNGGDEMSSRDELHMEAIRHCAAGLRPQALGFIMDYFSDGGMSPSAAEIYLNKLMNPDANPYSKLDKTIENHLLNWQEVTANDREDGYKEGIPLATTLLREFSTVYKVNGKGERVMKDGKPVIIRWSDDVIKKRIDGMIERLAREGAIPEPKVEEKDEKKEEPANTPSKPEKDKKEKQEPAKKETKTDKDKVVDKKQDKSNADGGKRPEPGKQGSAQAPAKPASNAAKTSKSAKSEPVEPATKEPVVTIRTHVDKESKNITHIHIVGTEVRGTTPKQGKAFTNFCTNKVKTYMGQALKEEGKKLKDPEFEITKPRPTGLEDWKQGEAFTINIESED